MYKISLMLTVALGALVTGLFQSGANAGEHISPSHSQSVKRFETPMMKAKLVEAMARYSEIIKNGGWPALKPDDMLRLGSEGPDVLALVARLNLQYPNLAAACGEVVALKTKKQLSKTSFFASQDDRAPCLFDSALQRHVETFQTLHGLSADGVVGPLTLSELNVPATERVKQIALNIQRMTSFEEFGFDKYVLVNIPEFVLRVVEAQEVRLEKKVVVGRPAWSTPSFTDYIETFIVNPDWRIPLSIATQEIAPKVANNPDYLKEQNIVIRKNSYVDDEMVDPATINWNEIKPYQFDHFMVRLPGEDNPLGEVKFLFPNKHAVYVHDTPAEQWFDVDHRAASHGCIRLEEPFSLAEVLTSELPDSLGFADIQKARSLNEAREFVLENPIPVHLVYWTSWAEDEYLVHFRRDLYEKDAEEYQAMVDTLQYTTQTTAL
ncbi:L,D-transpeptidase family protein [Alteromonas sp. A079]|uniref:L,D-transpeptidase family protein n=1 Tax=Alteromonas sp. A079 TaxID=3410268 RepID=UPI003BA38A36